MSDPIMSSLSAASEGRAHMRSIANADHYAWGSGCDGWHLVRAAALSVIEESMPPGTSEILHRHVHARQFFYVLHGVLELVVEGTAHSLTPRTGLEIAPMLGHQAHNRGPDRVEFLVISQPPSHGDRQAL